MNRKWFFKISLILGYFWTELFKDNWLISAIYKCFDYVLGLPILKVVLDIKKQSRFSYIPSTDALFPVRILVPVEASLQAINILKYFAMSEDYMTTYKIRKGLFNMNIPYSLQNKMEHPDYLLKLGVDYTIEGNNLILKDKENALAKFNKCLAMIDNIPCCCYLVWANIKCTKFILDTLSFILLLPCLWHYKYKNSLFTAWLLKQKGITWYNLSNFCKCFGIQIKGTDDKSFKWVYTLNGIMYIDFKDVLQLTNTIMPFSNPDTYELDTDYIKKCKAILPYIEYVLDTNETPKDFLNKMFSDMQLLFLIDKLLDEDITKAFGFIKKQLPLGTFMVVSRKGSTKSYLCYTSYSVAPLSYTILKKSLSRDPITVYNGRNEQNV